jgi:hypothetical protein
MAAGALPVSNTVRSHAALRVRVVSTRRFGWAPPDSPRSNFTGQYIGFEMSTRVITLHRGGAKFHRRAKQNEHASLERFTNA